MGNEEQQTTDYDLPKRMLILMKIKPFTFSRRSRVRFSVKIFDLSRHLRKELIVRFRPFQTSLGNILRNFPTKKRSEPFESATRVFLRRSSSVRGFSNTDSSSSELLRSSKKLCLVALECLAQTQHQCRLQAPCKRHQHYGIQILG